MKQSIERVRTVIDETAIKMRLNLDKSRAKKVNTKIFIESSRFEIRIAETFDEIREVLRLRYDIFLTEQLGRRLPYRLDLDEFDRVCDHLIVFDKAAQKIVGTYRIISSDTSFKFYSQGEFSIDSLLNLPGRKIELGRACIHPDYRRGPAVILLWRGLSEYLKLSGAQYLFGCSSVHTEDPLVAALIVQFLKFRGHWSGELRIEPLPEFHSAAMSQCLQTLGDSVSDFSDSFEGDILPPLLKGYLRAGAKVFGLPAFDRSFRCFDFFTILDSEKIQSSYRSKFMSGEA